MADTKTAAADGAPPAAKRIRLDAQLQGDTGRGSQVQLLCGRHVYILPGASCPASLQPLLGAHDLIGMLHTALQPVQRSPTAKTDSASMPGSDGGVMSAKASPRSVVAQGRLSVPVRVQAEFQAMPGTLLHAIVMLTAGDAC